VSGGGASRRRRVALALAVLGGLGALSVATWRLRAGGAPGVGAGRSGPQEARIQVLALCGAVAAHQAVTGTLRAAGPQPPEVPRGRAVPFPHDEAFEALEFHPGDAVRYQYEVVVAEDPVGQPEVTCYARGDLDGDGQRSVFRVTLDANGMTSPVSVEREDE
jgi:hypothetical protein